MDIHYERATVKVRVTDKDGNDLEMFGIRDSGPNTKECWIPSEEEEEFQITWGAKAPIRRYKNLALRAVPYLDGVKRVEGILTASQRESGESGCLDGEQVGVDRSSPFQFSRLRTTTDDLELEKHKNHIHAANLNTIKVVVAWGRATVRELSPEDVEETIFPPVRNRGLTHESNVKRGNYSAAILGEPVVTGSSPCTHTYTFRRDRKLEEFVFVFRYASLDWLREQGITPPPRRSRRAPSHTPDYINVDALDHDVKLESDTKVTQLPATQQGVFLDPEGEIEILKHLLHDSTKSASDPALDGQGNSNDDPVRAPLSPKSPSKKSVRISEAESPPRQNSSVKGKGREVVANPGPAASMPQLPSPPPSPRIQIRPRPRNRCCSGDPVSHPDIGEVSKKYGSVHAHETFECEDAVEPVRLLTLTRRTLVNEARARGGNALVDEVWEYTVSKRGKSGYTVKVDYTAAAAFVDGVHDPQKPVAIEIAKTKGINGLMTVTSRH
ncbi:unnamed protein product [Rhizoctonia solani]|uniref:DUF7918 domain-containing protein n=1 Tax=Rhizoctonia solani TaxID=456999 RepID=A0A8H3DL26_9AGAM|nr:unnamed protein product [Rhizoctonia solani]